jgi:hypothetical protein
MGKHDRGERVGQFCANPAETPCDDCSESKNYVEVCKPGTWFSHTFERRVRAAKAFTFDKKYEAHHIACVSPVNEVLYGNAKLRGAVAQTKWCINKKSNMVAMPLWGHTVKWYCAITAEGGEIDEDRKAPKFKNIPQHDYDHNCKEGYTWEVEQKLKELAAEIKEADHDLKGDDLAAELDAISDDFRSKLIDKRGMRKGGTHKAWKLAQDDPDDETWCHPFSMASDKKVSSKGFPVRSFDSAVAKWIDRIAGAIAGA